MSLSTYEVAKRRVIVYLREVLHQKGYADWKTALPDRICQAIGFKPRDHSEAVRFIIAFSQSKVVNQVWTRRRKINKAMRGQIGPEFYQTLAWKKLRYLALARSAGKCECCGALGDKSPLHVDHIKPRSKYPELALALDNLQVLCADCNIGKLNTDETDWRKPVLKIVA